MLTSLFLSSNIHITYAGISENVSNCNCSVLSVWNTLLRRQGIRRNCNKNQTSKRCSGQGETAVDIYLTSGKQRGTGLCVMGEGQFYCLWETSGWWDLLARVTTRFCWLGEKITMWKPACQTHVDLFVSFETCLWGHKFILTQQKILLGEVLSLDLRKFLQCILVFLYINIAVMDFPFCPAMNNKVKCVCREWNG